MNISVKVDFKNVKLEKQFTNSKGEYVSLELEPFNDDFIMRVEAKKRGKFGDYWEKHFCFVNWIDEVYADQDHEIKSNTDFLNELEIDLFELTKELKREMYAYTKVYKIRIEDAWEWKRFFDLWIKEWGIEKVLEVNTETLSNMISEKIAEYNTKQMCA